MSDNRPLQEDHEKAHYNSLVASINYEYSKKYGYDFIYYRPYLNDKNTISLNNCIDPNTKALRHSAWSKLLSTQLALNATYDYVVYTDSDCMFKDFSKSIEQFIQPYLSKDILYLNNKPWGDDIPCSGFYICKVSSTTKDFLKDWYSFDFKNRKNPFHWEQGALFYLFKIKKYNIGIINHWMFKEYPGQFLRHISRVEEKLRIPYFKNFISKNNINYSKNIQDIKCIDYNTAEIN